MRRRDFITFLGSAAAWPLVASAQQSGKVWRIGFLAGGARPTNLEGTAYSAFLRGMRELGYTENQNFIVEWRFAEGRLELLSTLAEELVQLNVDVIVVGLTAAIPIAQRATGTIPIVMAISVDPVGNGYVTSLARPTGNVTGLASSQDEIISKQLQLAELLSHKWRQESGESHAGKHQKPFRRFQRKQSAVVHHVRHHCKLPDVKCFIFPTVAYGDTDGCSGQVTMLGNY